MKRLVAGLLLVLVASACRTAATSTGTDAGVDARTGSTSAGSPTATPTAPPAPSAPSAPSADAGPPTPPEPAAPADPAVLVEQAAVLRGVHLRRDGEDLAVQSLWAWRCDGGPCGPVVLARSSDGFRTAEYERSRWTDFDTPFRMGVPGAPKHGSCAQSIGGVFLCTDQDWHLRRTDDGGHTWTPSTVDFGEPLMITPVVSLRPGVLAVTGGSDGATLYPLQKAARSSDGGASWEFFEIGEQDGAMPYSSGGVALSDGRLLDLIGDWSDDRIGRPSQRHHGLWVSDGEDWSRYGPHRPRFDPPLADPPRGGSPLVVLRGSAEPDPVVWVETWDQRVYVSTDDAATFHEIVVR